MKEIIFLIVIAVFIIGCLIFGVCNDAKSTKKERVTKIYHAKNEREVVCQIRNDSKANKWEIFDVTPLKQTDDYIKVIAIFEVR